MKIKIVGLIFLLLVSPAAAQKVAHRIGKTLHYPSYTISDPAFFSSSPTPSPVIGATSSTTQRIGIYTYTDYETPQGRVSATQQTIGPFTHVDYETPQGTVYATYQTIGGITHGDYSYSYRNSCRRSYYDTDEYGVSDLHRTPLYWRIYQNAPEYRWGEVAR